MVLQKREIIKITPCFYQSIQKRVYLIVQEYLIVDPIKSGGCVVDCQSFPCKSRFFIGICRGTSGKGFNSLKLITGLQYLRHIFSLLSATCHSKEFVSHLLTPQYPPCNCSCISPQQLFNEFVKDEENVSKLYRGKLQQFALSEDDF